MERVSSIHAEDNVIRKLPNIKSAGKRTKKVDMMVIRVNHSGDLASSKPCINCIVLMSSRLPDKGYTLRDVYFSNAQGNLELCRFRSLLQSNDHHVSRFHKDRGLDVEALVSKISKQ